MTTRYAPSPTGHLHLGHVAHLLYVWGVARALDARVLLRIEDHDASRSRPEYEASIVEDLAWLGFSADNELTPDYRQSDCQARYQKALEKLREAARVYACDCTRAELARRVAANADGERPYDGRCRERGLPLETGALRVEVPPEDVAFEDGYLGLKRQTPQEQCGDLLLRDRGGQWTYQFAVVVDDIRHGVDLIVRGEDLLASTGRQIVLGRMLGAETESRYFHHPLILDEAGAKLSKRTAAGPIRDARRAGRSAEQVIGEAAHRVGLADSADSMSLDRALDLVARTA